MANNRMWLTCTNCDDKFFLVKYYPSTGWYRPASRIQEFGSDLNAWLDKHQHRSACGDEIVLYKETDETP